MASMNTKQPPLMRDGLAYAEWKKELDIWSDFTDLDSCRQGGALFLTLTGKAREAVLSGVPREKIKSEKGLEEITLCLDELYEKDKSQSAFAAYDDFTNYRRSRNTTIQDYIVEFNLKYNKIKVHDMELPDAVLAYYLLKCANLPDELNNICKATCTDLSYKNMRTQIEKVTSNMKHTSSENSNDVHPQYYSQEEAYQESHEYDDADGDRYNDHDQGAHFPDAYQHHSSSDVYPNYARGSHDVFYQQRWQGRTRGTYNRPTGPSSTQPRQNPLDEFGNPSRCSFCRSIYHWVDRCPEAQHAGYGNRRQGPRRSPRGRASFRGGRGDPRPSSRYGGPVI